MRGIYGTAFGSWARRVVVAAAGDALTSLSDTFSTGTTARGNGWTLEDVNGAFSSDAVAGGTLDLQITEGGSGGSFWFDSNVGILLYKTVTGACDMRARVRIRNTANDAAPSASNFRIAGIAAHDPDRSTNEYVHIGIGSTNTTGNRIEWKTTDNSDSAFNFNDTGLDHPLDYDIRIVRRASDLQVFDLYYRETGVEPLSSNDGWTLFVTIDRSDDTVPNRVANSGSTAVQLPNTLRWGLMLYASTAEHDIRIFYDEVLFSTPT